jgi:hypothetical protein
LVEEIEEKAAEIISGGQSGNFLNKEISALDSPNNEPRPVPNPVPNPVINPETGAGTDPSGDGIPPIAPTSFTFG